MKTANAGVDFRELRGWIFSSTRVRLGTFPGGGTLNVDLRSVEETVRAARARENMATAEADAARQAREDAERLVGPAKRQAQQTSDAVGRQATERLDRLQEQLDRVVVRAKADTTRPEVAMRIRCRAFRHGGGSSPLSDEVQTPSSVLMGITQLDAIAGQFFECSRVGGQLMQMIFDQGASEELADRADELECRAWASLMNRIRVLAGES